ncbi:hypothetical protein LIER_25840 [Lithospermum erythrorhizon]|uniref:Lipoxygenase domain-containing protein n=1 Tax=Lithospermum erythrorhizon TaxID=34254 RepID=A0AAV3R7L6_LITER
MLELRQCILDPFFETGIEPPNQFYVPRDEDFEEVKQKSFSSSRLKGLLHSLIPRIAADMSHSSDLPLNSVSDIDKLYSDGVVLENEEKGLLENKFGSTVENEEKDGLAISKMFSNIINNVSTVTQSLLKFDLPA